MVLILSPWGDDIPHREFFFLFSLCSTLSSHIKIICCVCPVFCFFLCRRTFQMWQRSCLMRALRRAVTIFLTPEVQKTAAVTSLKRAGEEGGCGEVLRTVYMIISTLCTPLHHLKLFVKERCTHYIQNFMFIGSQHS